MPMRNTVAACNQAEAPPTVAPRALGRETISFTEATRPWWGVRSSNWAQVPLAMGFDQTREFTTIEGRAVASTQAFDIVVTGFTHSERRLARDRLDKVDGRNLVQVNAFARH